MDKIKEMRTSLETENSKLENYKYFSNTKCEYYTNCHGNMEKNCLFCFCPLYMYDCIGNPKFLSNGVKDCSDCTLPHLKSGYSKIIEFLKNKHR